MKYSLILVFIILIFATHINDREPVLKEYDCTSLMAHGTFAHWNGFYENPEAAMIDAKLINKRLIDSGAIPDSCIAMCFSEGNIFR